MPVISITTNIAAEDSQLQELERISSNVATMLGKPESYVMVMLQQNPDMIFAGNGNPTAYVELKSIGLPADKTEHYSAQLCDLIESTIGIPKERIYIEFASAERKMFGWNGGTF